jgi:hypothetical protein
MAFDATLLSQVVQIGFSSPRSIWVYGNTTRTTNSSTECAAVGFFAGMGSGGRATNDRMQLGDIVIVNAATGTTFSSTGKVSWHNVINSTCNQVSSSASTGFGASYDITISAGTT